MVVLDSDHMSLLEWTDSPTTRRLANRLRQLPEGEVATTVINYEEQTRGWMTLIASTRKVADQIQAYRRLKIQLDIFCGLTILLFDELAAVEFTRLKRIVPRLGTMDLKIAAIVVASDATLLSRNHRDFDKVPGLKIEDWTI